MNTAAHTSRSLVDVCFLIFPLVRAGQGPLAIARRTGLRRARVETAINNYEMSRWTDAGGEFAADGPWYRLSAGRREHWVREGLACGLSLGQIATGLQTVPKTIRKWCHANRVPTTSRGLLIERFGRFDPRRKPAQADKVPASAWDPIEGSRPVTLADAATDQCRWPLSEGLFCGARVVPGRSYCAGHCARARAREGAA